MHTTEQGLALLKISIEKIFYKTTQHSQKGIVNYPINAVHRLRPERPSLERLSPE
jgi:hypothetical protein